MDMNDVIVAVRIVLVVALAVVLFAAVLRAARHKKERWDPENAKKPFFLLSIDVILLVITAVMLLLALLVSLQWSIKDDIGPEVTAANTPVNLFLEMSPDLSIETAEDMADDYGWCVMDVASYDTDGTRLRQISVSVDDVLEQDEDKYYVELTLYYKDDGDDPSLLYAVLVITTEDGTASCYYYPTDYTQYGYETGFNLTVKAKGKIRSQTYLLGTAQDVVDTAYAVVYPDGLS